METDFQFFFYADEIMPFISPNAWKVLTVILRRTVAADKTSAEISYANFKQATGITSMSTLSAIFRELAMARIIEVVPSTDNVSGNLYKILPPTEFIKPVDRKRAGYIYLVRGGGYCKIGKARTLDKRMAAFLRLPFSVELVHSIAVEDTFEAESTWHARFAHKRINGEWFDLDEADVALFCNGR